MAILLAFLAGLLLGVFFPRRTVGNLRVDQSDSDGPYLFLELDSPDMRAIIQKRYVVLRVRVENFLSHE